MVNSINTFDKADEYLKEQNHLDYSTHSCDIAQPGLKAMGGSQFQVSDKVQRLLGYYTHHTVLPAITWMVGITSKGMSSKWKSKRLYTEWNPTVHSLTRKKIGSYMLLASK